MCPSAPRVCSEPGGQKLVLSLSLDRIAWKWDEFIKKGQDCAWIQVFCHWQNTWNQAKTWQISCLNLNDTQCSSIIQLCLIYTCTQNRHPTAHLLGWDMWCLLWAKTLFVLHSSPQRMHRQISDIRCAFVDNNNVDHSDAVGASPVGAAPTTSSFSTHDFNGLGTDYSKTRWETSKFWDLNDLVQLILKVWW